MERQRDSSRYLARRLGDLRGCRTGRLDSVDTRARQDGTALEFRSCFDGASCAVSSSAYQTMTADLHTSRGEPFGLQADPGGVAQLLSRSNGGRSRCGEI